MKSKHARIRLWILLIVAAVVSVSAIIYVNSTSVSSSSKDGIWKGVAYKENIFLHLWTGNVFYFGEEPVGDIKIECKTEDKMYDFETSPDSESPGIYKRLLAGKNITDSYTILDLHYGNPELEEVKIFWTDAGGNQHDCLLSFN